MFERVIMFAYGSGNLGLDRCEIEIFIDHCDVDIHRTGLAMVAIHTFSFIRVFRRAGDSRRIIFFLVGRGFVTDGVANVPRFGESAHNGGDGGSGERVMQALQRGEGDTERGGFGLKKPASSEPFHDGYPNIEFFA